MRLTKGEWRTGDDKTKKKMRGKRSQDKKVEFERNPTRLSCY